MLAFTNSGDVALAAVGALAAIIAALIVATMNIRERVARLEERTLKLLNGRPKGE